MGTRMIKIIKMIKMVNMILLIRYGDLAVGAPYSGVDSAGAVFIFRGGRTGVREDPDQVIAFLLIIIIVLIAIVMIICNR